MKHKQRKLTFRLPADLARKVEAQSKEERRSLNTQLIVLVERGLRLPCPTD